MVIITSDNCITESQLFLPTCICNRIYLIPNDLCIKASHLFLWPQAPSVNQARFRSI